MQIFNMKGFKNIFFNFICVAFILIKKRRRKVINIKKQTLYIFNKEKEKKKGKYKKKKKNY